MAIFSLNEVKIEQVKNVANNNFASWPESAIYGYYAGGEGTFPNVISTITRLDFSNETVNNPGKNLPAVRSYFASVFNSSFGYFGGGSGSFPSFFSTITRIDFSNENISTPGQNIPSNTAYIASVSSSLYGYFGGGSSPAGNHTTISRLDFSNETVSNPNKNFSAVRYEFCGTSSNSYGYFFGGYAIPTPLSSITRLDFSNETVSDPGRNLSYNSRQSIATSNVSYGYLVSGNPNVSTISRLDFSNETVNLPGKNLVPGRSSSAETRTNSYGYFGGGYIGPPATLTSQIIRLDFTAETTSSVGNLPSARQASSGVSGGASFYRDIRGFGTYGYFGGGYSGLPNPPPFTKNLICRLDFSTDSFTQIGSFPFNRYNVSTFSDKNNGYFVGGQSTPGINYNNLATRISFPTETISAANPTNTSRGGATGLSGKYCGYSLGGGPSTVWRTGIKYDYSTGNKTDTNDLTDDMFSDSGSVENLSYGYVTGGTTSNCRRFEFSSETITNLTNRLPTSLPGSAGISHRLYGYFFGGSSPTGISRSTVVRLDFTAETTSLPGNNLSIARENITATQSATYGYLVGGQIPVGPPTVYDETSAVNRFDFSTETITPTTNYPTTISDSGAVSNHSKYNLYT